jgi:pseudouridine synthase
MPRGSRGPGDRPGRADGKGRGGGDKRGRADGGGRGGRREVEPRRGGGDGAGRGQAAGANRGRKPDEELRLQAYLARGGVASRRGAEDLIKAGRVTVNGVKAEIGSKVIVGKDRVTVNGKAVVMLKPEWIALHKPAGYVATRDDPEGRRTIYSLLPPDLHHLFHVGRLDRASTGLILLTNEGETANRLLHPRYGTTKEYLADVEGVPKPGDVKRLVEGVELDDGIAQAAEVELIGQRGEGVSRLRIVLQEGRNREVRRMLEVIGHPVKSLYRRRFGPITVGRLKRGEYRRLSKDEIEELRGTPSTPKR